MTPEPPEADILVVGDGPAAWAATLRTAQLGGRAIAFAGERGFHHECASDWLADPGLAVLQRLLPDAAASAASLAQISLHDAKLEQRVDVAADGWSLAVIRLAELHELFKDALSQFEIAAQAVPIEQVTAAEAGVAVETAADETATGAMLLLDDAATSASADRIGLLSAGRAETAVRGWQAVYAADAEETAMHIVVQPAPGVNLCAILLHHGGATVTATGTAVDEDLAATTRTTVQRLADAGVIAMKARDVLAERLLPCGAAVEMENHVGKRSVLIGQAGGFVAAFSGEGLYASMRSGVLASELAMKAAGATWPQDTLARFGATWRRELAEHLRMPNTDLGMLLPLVFRNEQMARRLVRAFVLGRDF